LLSEHEIKIPVLKIKIETIKIFLIILLS